MAALRDLEKRQWLMVLYCQGPPRIFDMAAISGMPPSAYLMLDARSEARLHVEQEQGRAVRQATNIPRLFYIDVRPDENRIVMGGARGLIGEWDLETLSTNPTSDMEGDAPVPLQATF